jgi:hypothetical protein
MSFGFRFNRGYPWFYFHLVTEFIFHFCLVEPQINFVSGHGWSPVIKLV